MFQYHQKLIDLDWIFYYLGFEITCFQMRMILMFTKKTTLITTLFSTILTNHFKRHIMFLAYPIVIIVLQWFKSTFRIIPLIMTSTKSSFISLYSPEIFYRYLIDIRISIHRGIIFTDYIGEFIYQLTDLWFVPIWLLKNVN